MLQNSLVGNINGPTNDGAKAWERDGKRDQTNSQTFAKKSEDMCTTRTIK